MLNIKFNGSDEITFYENATIIQENILIKKDYNNALADFKNGINYSDDLSSYASLYKYNNSIVAVVTYDMLADPQYFKLENITEFENLKNDSILIDFKKITRVSGFDISLIDLDSEILIEYATSNNFTITLRCKEYSNIDNIENYLKDQLIDYLTLCIKNYFDLKDLIKLESRL